MAKLTDIVVSSSFHGVTIKTTVNLLEKAVGKAQFSDNLGDDKTNFDWDCETENGDYFSIYDWKHYRPIGKDELIEFHIGALNHSISLDAKHELLKQIKNI